MKDMWSAVGGFACLSCIYDSTWPVEPHSLLTTGERLRRMFEERDLVYEGVFPDPRFAPDRVTGNAHQPEGQILMAKLIKILEGAAADGGCFGWYWVVRGLDVDDEEYYLDAWNEDDGWSWTTRDLPSGSGVRPGDVVQVCQRVALAELALRSGLVESVLLSSPLLKSLGMPVEASAGGYAYIDWIGSTHPGLPINLFPLVNDRLGSPIPRERVSRCTHSHLCPCYINRNSTCCVSFAGSNSRTDASSVRHMTTTRQDVLKKPGPLTANTSSAFVRYALYNSVDRSSAWLSRLRQMRSTEKGSVCLQRL